jgi:nucleoside-diphosphate-sugar epimerase
MKQKAAVEAVLRDPSFGLRTTFIRPAMFMEEWWKHYTRPGILQGTLTLALPRDRPLQLTAVRDVGYAAAEALRTPGRAGSSAFELAGDELTPTAMADAFAAAQRAPVRAVALPAWPLALLRPGLYDVVRFLRDVGYGVDVAECRRAHPFVLSFQEFLSLTRWEDPSRTYADGIRYADAEAALAARGPAQRPADGL